MFSPNSSAGRARIKTAEFAARVFARFFGPRAGLTRIAQQHQPLCLMSRRTPETVIVRDKMQRNYRYTLTEPEGKNFDPEFKPQLTPKQMLALGIFGGKYMNDCKAEFPKSWFAGAKLSAKKNPGLNYFGVDASKPLSYWQQKGWICEDDPRGWFQWYCRYYRGRRIADDARQIRRWKQLTRHIAQLQKHCEPGDLHCRPRQRQALLHWAYDSRKI